MLCGSLILHNNKYYSDGLAVWLFDNACGLNQRGYSTLSLVSTGMGDFCTRVNRLSMSQHTPKSSQPSVVGGTIK